MDRKNKVKNRLQKKLQEKNETKEVETKIESKTNERLSFDNTKIFQSIVEFIDDISNTYGENDKLLELKAYNILLSKTTLKHKKEIENHVNIFRQYCKLNEKPIM